MLPKQFTPTADQISAASTLFVAIAFRDTIKPIVQGYQRTILEELQLTEDTKYFELDGRDPATAEVITDPNRYMELSYEDVVTVCNRCHVERDRLKLTVDDPEACPLLVAENNITKAKHVLIDLMEPTTGIGFDDLWWKGDGVKTYNEYVDLLERMMAPFCDSRKIMADLVNTPA